TGFWTGLMAANMLAAAQLAPCFHGRPALVHIHGAHSWRLRARREPFQCCRSWTKACNRYRSALPRPPSATSRLIIDSVAGFKHDNFRNASETLPCRSIIGPVPLLLLMRCQAFLR